jgi:DNA polymerase III subunit gamma/tau
VCAACTAIDAGRFIDYTELDAASNRGVDEVQQLLEQAVYKPVQGRFKVFMIDEVHMLTNTAFNAMLKTLEEPPEYLKFVLATTDPQKVPVTVLSRCLQFNLRPMAPETVHEHLVQLMATEQVTADDASLRLLSRSARGSMRDALSLTDQAIAFGNGVLAEASVRQMLGAVDRTYVFRLIDALARGDGKSVVDTSEDLRINGLSAASTLEDMASVLQRMAVVQNVPDAYDSTDSEAVETARLAGLMPPDETQLLYSLCIHGRAELGLAPDEYAGLTMTLLRLLAFKPKGFKPAGPSASAADGAEKKSLNSAPLPSPAAVAPAAHAVPTPAPALPVAPAPIPVAHQAQHNTQENNDFSDVDIEKFAINNVVTEELNSAHIEADIASSLPELSAPKQQFSDVNAQQSASSLIAVPIREQSVPTSRTEQRISAVMPDAVHQAWINTVQQLLDAEAVTALTRELAVQSQCVEQGAQHLTLRVDMPSLDNPAAREKLQTAFAALGRSEVLTVERGPVVDSWFKRNQARIAARLLAAENLIMNDPLVLDMQAHWGGKVVAGSIKAL